MHTAHLRVPRYAYDESFAYGFIPMVTVSLGDEQRHATSLKYLQRRDCNGVDLDLLPLNLTKTK